VQRGNEANEPVGPGSSLGNCHLTSPLYHGWRNMALCSQVHHHWRVGSLYASCSFRRADRRCDRFVGDAAVGKSSLLVRLTDQRFLANPDPTVSSECSHAVLPHLMNCGWTQLGVEFGSKLITIPEEEKVVKLQCTSRFLLCHSSTSTTRLDIGL